MTDFSCLLNNDVALVRRVFSSNNVNAVNNEGYTPLYFCCMKNSISCTTISELIKLGASVDAKGDDGETPLFIATFQNREDVVNLLLSHEADVNSINSTRKDTALHVASRLGYDPLVQLLIKKGANINARNAAQETPTFCAAKHGRHNTLYHLIVAGANMKLTNQDGKDPLFIASERNYKNAVLVLKAKKDELKHARAAADAEVRNAAIPIRSSEEIVEREKSNKEVKAKDRSQVKETKKQEQKQKVAPAEIIEIHVPKPKVRTHDPFSGAAFGPCKTLEEVGYDEPPAIPKELKNRPPSSAPRIGGTSMMVETESGPVKPVQIDELEGGDVQTSFYLPSNLHY